MEEEKKKVRVGQKIKFFILSLLPALGFYAISYLVVIIVETVFLFKNSAAIGNMEIEEIQYFVAESLNKYLLEINCATQLIIICFSLLILFGALKTNVFGNPIKRIGGLKTPGIVFTFIGLELLISSLLTIIDKFFPNVLAEYEEFIESTGLADLTLISSITTIVLAPLCEELIMRGLTIYILKKMSTRFWLVNIIQAIIFGALHLNWANVSQGILHMNLVQGIYAMVLGLALGWIFEKTNSLWASILAHAVFNVSGTWIVAAIFSESSVEEVAVIKLVIVTVISIAAAVAGLWMVSKKDREVVTNE